MNCKQRLVVAGAIQPQLAVLPAVEVRADRVRCFCADFCDKRLQLLQVFRAVVLDQEQLAPRRCGDDGAVQPARRQDFVENEQQRDGIKLVSHSSYNRFFKLVKSDILVLKHSSQNIIFSSRIVRQSFVSVFYSYAC